MSLAEVDVSMKELRQTKRSFLRCLPMIGAHWIRGNSRVICLVLLTLLGQVDAFSQHSALSLIPRTGVTLRVCHDVGEDADYVSRRWALQQGLLGLTAAFVTTTTTTISFPQKKNAAEDIRGIPLTPFNGLIFNYKGSDFAGLDASTLNEPSIPYQEFVQKLKGGQVAFVEFLAPYGDAAYVTFKDEKGNASGAPIRVGEGYPIEQHDGYSSPAFAIRTVVNEGVSYKFTVPGLAKYK